MLKLYRRHLRGKTKDGELKCKHVAKGRAYLRCKCPIWVDGMLAGKRLHHSMEMRDWEKASGKILEWESAGKVPAEDQATVTIEKATERFTIYAMKNRKLKKPTLKKYRVLFDQLKAFCQNRGIRYVSQFNLTILEDFQSSWADGAISASKKLERFRALYAFMERHKWVEENLAGLLSKPKINQIPTLPFSREEMTSLIDGSTGRMRALILLLRYSGLRVQDAAGCSVDRLVDGKLLIYTAKTEQPVYCVLPSMCLQALSDIEPVSQRYWFWTGTGSKDTLAGNYRRMLRKVAKKVGVKNAHPHRFRDTFAVELLLAGVPLERVSILLGHASVKVTEKHYAPWVHARQVQLEKDVRSTWAEDPVLMAGKPKLERIK